MRGLFAWLLILLALAIGGCGRVQRAEVDLQVQQRTDASRAGLTLARAKEIVAEVAEVQAADVTVMHRSIAGPEATILAFVPAAQDMRYEEARKPSIPESVTEQKIETIDLRWDIDAGLPTLILWSERLQYAPHEPVTTQQAEAVARELIERWVPKQAGEIEPGPAQKLQGPIYVVNWVGMLDGHFTGDRAMVQVSSVTGLPISFSQRIALQRPSPDSISLTRDEAIATVRTYLRDRGVPNADAIDLVAQLTLSAEGHPTGGPAWLVAIIGPNGQQTGVLAVDAMTGEVLAGGGSE